MDEMRDALLRLPECIEPPLHTPRPNSPLELLETEVVLSAGGEPLVGPGRIWFSWLPRPGPRFEMQAPGSLRSFESLGSTLRVGEPETQFQVLVTELNHSEGAEIRGIINGHARFGEIGEADSISHVTFALSNFHHYIGDAIRPSGERLKTWKGRWSIRADPWRITIDELEDSSVLMKQLKSDGGHAITHAGRLERIDGAEVTLSELAPVINGLQFFFAFCRGMWCGPVFPTYWHRERYSRSIAPWHLSCWRDVGSWFPRFGPLEALSRPVSRFLFLWADKAWQRPLQHYLWWYIEANLAATLESAIVKIQAALELIGWLVLVEQDEVLSPDGFEMLPASDKMRLLLTHLSIPITIPDHLANLETYARSMHHATGPGVFVSLRNAIVHPSLKKRRRMERVNKLAKFETTELGRQYLEFVLLSLLEYEGRYEDRTDTQRWAGLGDHVPWKRGDENA